MSGSYGSGLSPGRNTLSGKQNKQASGYGDLVRKVLGDPALYPDTFLGFLPQFLRYNANFKVEHASLPANGTIHLVGATGEEAVFLNGWVNFGTSNSLAGYYIDPWGIVHLQGTVKNGTLNSTIFSLPAGWRPQTAVIFPVVCNGAFGCVTINTTGAVTMSGGGSNAYITLDGISFRQFA